MQGSNYVPAQSLAACPCLEHTSTHQGSGAGKASGAHVGAHVFNRLHCSADDSGGSSSSSGDAHPGSTGPRSAPWEDSSCTLCRSPPEHAHAMGGSGSPLLSQPIASCTARRECQSVWACWWRAFVAGYRRRLAHLVCRWYVQIAPTGAPRRRAGDPLCLARDLAASGGLECGVRRDRRGGRAAQSSV